MGFLWSSYAARSRKGIGGGAYACAHSNARTRAYTNACDAYTCAHGGSYGGYSATHPHGSLSIHTYTCARDAYTRTHGDAGTHGNTRTHSYAGNVSATKIRC